jgi:hypothetical protein
MFASTARVAQERNLMNNMRLEDEGRRELDSEFILPVTKRLGVLGKNWRPCHWKIYFVIVILILKPISLVLGYRFAWICIEVTQRSRSWYRIKMFYVDPQSLS